LATTPNGNYHDTTTTTNLISRRRSATMLKNKQQQHKASSPDELLTGNHLQLNEIACINSTHNSILNQENCFEIKYHMSGTSEQQEFCKYFLCRSTDEKEKWLYIIKHVINPNYDHERHTDNTLQLCLLEAKGNGIQQSHKKKYFCEILINNCVHARTCLKEKKDILFWGENFEFQ
jgi:hypothetical protein